MTSPVSQVLLCLDKPLQDEIVTKTGLKFYIDPSYNKNFQATVTAKISALPIKASSKKDEKILSQLNVGDEVAISYMIVGDLTFGSDSGRFMAITEGNDFMQSFINGKGEKIDVVVLPGKISKIWVGYYRNKRGELINGVQGTESEVSRWKAQFQFGKTDDYVFNNFFEHQKQDYWKADLTDIFAKKVDGRLVAVGDRIIMKPIEENVPEDVAKQFLHKESVKIRYVDRGRIISGGKSKGLKKDQIVHFDPRYCEKYDFWNKEYYLIREDRIMGIWSKN